MNADNAFYSSFEEILKQGLSKTKIAIEDVIDGDILQITKSGGIWYKIESAEELRREIKEVDYIDVWRL